MDVHSVKALLTTSLLSFLLAGCELPIPNIPKEPKPEEQETPPPTTSPPKVKKAPKVYKTRSTAQSLDRQNINKSFDDIDSPIIPGKAKHSFPPANLLE